MCVSDLIYREDAYSTIELMDKFALIDNENDSLNGMPMPEMRKL